MSTTIGSGTVPNLISKKGYLLNQKATDKQIGGTHYKDYEIQPVEFAMRNKLDLCQANIVKYTVRFRDKGGLEDLLKARHYIDLLIEYEYGKQEE